MAIHHIDYYYYYYCLRSSQRLLWIHNLSYNNNDPTNILNFFPAYYPNNHPIQIQPYLRLIIHRNPIFYSKDLRIIQEWGSLQSQESNNKQSNKGNHNRLNVTITIHPIPIHHKDYYHYCFLSSGYYSLLQIPNLSYNINECT